MRTEVVGTVNLGPDNSGVLNYNWISFAKIKFISLIQQQKRPT